MNYAVAASFLSKQPLEFFTAEAAEGRGGLQRQGHRANGIRWESSAILCGLCG